jgi:hypothetical protein
MALLQYPNQTKIVNIILGISHDLQKASNGDIMKNGAQHKIRHLNLEKKIILMAKLIMTTKIL